MNLLYFYSQSFRFDKCFARVIGDQIHFLVDFCSKFRGNAWIAIVGGTMSRHPEVKWAQRSDKLYITIELPDANNPKLKLEPEGKFTFSATAGKDEATYELDFDLYDRVNVEASKINIGLRNIFCIIQKEQKGWWKRLLKNEGKRLSNVKVDWDKWVDEDEEKDDKFGRDMDFGNMDFSKLDMGDDEADNEYEPGNEDEPVDEIEDELPSEETAKKEPVKEEAVAGEPAKE